MARNDLHPDPEIDGRGSTGDPGIAQGPSSSTHNWGERSAADYAQRAGAIPSGAQWRRGSLTYAAAEHLHGAGYAPAANGAAASDPDHPAFHYRGNNNASSRAAFNLNRLGVCPACYRGAPASTGYGNGRLAAATGIVGLGDGDRTIWWCDACINEHPTRGPGIYRDKFDCTLGKFRR